MYWLSKDHERLLLILFFERKKKTLKFVFEKLNYPKLYNSIVEVD